MLERSINTQLDSGVESSIYDTRGGGGVPPSPGPTENAFLLEDGTNLLLEDGTNLLLEVA